MYARIDNTGDGVVNSSCDMKMKVPAPSKVIPSNLGVYSGCCPLPDVHGNLLNISSNYVPMIDEPQQTCFISRLGLTEMPDYKIQQSGIGTDGYFYPMDGRVVDNVRGMRLILDRPAVVGSVDMDLVSNFDNSNYAANYKTYSDIRNGQIAYYVDPSHSQPFENPVYTLSSTVDKFIRKDPMDSVKPEYIKTPITTTLYNVSKDQQTRDTLWFREDIISRQQNKYNRTDWTNRWVVPPQEFAYRAKSF